MWAAGVLTYVLMSGQTPFGSHVDIKSGLHWRFRRRARISLKSCWSSRRKSVWRLMDAWLKEDDDEETRRERKQVLNDDSTYRRQRDMMKNRYLNWWDKSVLSRTQNHDHQVEWLNLHEVNWIDLVVSTSLLFCLHVFIWHQLILYCNKYGPFYLFRSNLKLNCWGLSLDYSLLLWLTCCKQTWSTIHFGYSRTMKRSLGEAWIGSRYKCWWECVRAIYEEFRQLEVCSIDWCLVIAFTLTSMTRRDRACWPFQCSEGR